MSSASRPATRRSAADAYARFLVSARWWVIAFWGIATLAALVWLPSPNAGGGGIAGLLSSDTPAVKTERRTVELFGFPLMGRTIVVQRDPAGLPLSVQRHTVDTALAVDRDQAGPLGRLEGALPLTNGLGLFPGAREADTTALTYLLFPPSVSLGTQTRGAERYERRYFGPSDHVVGVTGSVPARAEQGDIIRDSLPMVEVVTLIAIALIVGLSFRSVVAPLVTLVTAGVAFVITLRLFAVLARRLDLAAPSELQPVVVALLLGIVTDYVVFFCTAFKSETSAEAGSQAAARAAISRYAPVVLVAGLAVASGTAALLVAESAFFRALGPALVFTVVVGLTVAITLGPALMAVLGRHLFWPARRAIDDSPANASTSNATAPKPSRRLAAIIGSRRIALGAVVASTVAMLIAATPVSSLRLGVSFIDALPDGTAVRMAADSAESGFSPGILSPTVVLIEGRGVADQRAALHRLGGLLAQEPSIAGVLAPGRLPLRLDRRLLLAGSDAARLLIVLDDEPLGAAAISALEHVEDRLPTLLRDSGLSGVTTGVAGDTAAAAYLVEQTQDDLLRIALAALAANLLMLMLFLRAVLASVLLLCGSLLSLTATLGITTLVFSAVAPGQGLTFYVPLAAAILLLAFGSDYNIFSVGQVWTHAKHQPLTEAMKAVLPRATRALTTAGLSLAASFGLLALVPLLPFRQLAFAVGVGITVDVLLVRSLLAPALLRLMGPRSAWPSHRVF